MFESDFHLKDSPGEIFEISCRARDIDEDKYIRAAYFGVMARLDIIDGLIGEHSRGWKTYRMSGISRSAMRLSVWEMLYMESIPRSVSINEAIEIVKKYDDPRARTFVNGILNAVKEYIEKNPGAGEGPLADEKDDLTEPPEGNRGDRNDAGSEAPGAGDDKNTGEAAEDAGLKFAEGQETETTEGQETETTEGQETGATEGQETGAAEGQETEGAEGQRGK